MHHHHHGLDQHVLISIGFALLSAVAFAVATVAQQRAASQVSDADVEQGRLIWVLIRRPLWWAGTSGNLGGYIFQAIALGFGSLLVVQPLLVTSILFALPLEARIRQVRLPHSVRYWGAVLVICLAVFMILGNPNHGREFPHDRAWVILTVTVGPLLVLCFLAGMRRSGGARSSLIALVVGVLAGIAALLTKVVVGLIGEGPSALVSHGSTYALIVVGLGGVYLQQIAFQAGSLRTSMPIIQVVEPVTAALLGVTMLDEHLRAGPVGLTVLFFVTVLMTVATIRLSLDQAEVEGDSHHSGTPTGAEPGSSLPTG